MKFKICPQCEHKNTTVLNKCSECGHDLNDVRLFDDTPPPEERLNYEEQRALIGIIMFAIALVLAILMFVFGFEF